MRRALVPLAVALVGATALTGCSKSASTSSPDTTFTAVKPDLKEFLKLPVATPTACPPSANGVTVGRRSPWVGTVDISIFLKLSATPRQKVALARVLHTNPKVKTIYFESQAEAYQEFRRLYTCSASVSQAQTPASYRVVLGPTATLTNRNTIVRQVARMPGVDSVSCDPAVPCVSIIRGLSSSPGTAQ